MMQMMQDHPGYSLPAARCRLPAGLLVSSPLAFVAAGALLATIPIIIHILNRRRFRTIQWAAMNFLLQAMRKNRRRLRFEHWLLLAVRCCLLLLLGLALARPMGCNESSSGQHRGTTLWNACAGDRQQLCPWPMKRIVPMPRPIWIRPRCWRGH